MRLTTGLTRLGGFITAQPLSGDHTGGATPVPIPNTAVKTARPMIVLTRESRSSPDSFIANAALELHFVQGGVSAARPLNWSSTELLLSGSFFRWVDRKLGCRDNWECAGLMFAVYLNPPCRSATAG